MLYFQVQTVVNTLHAPSELVSAQCSLYKPQLLLLYQAVLSFHSLGDGLHVEVVSRSQLVR